MENELELPQSKNIAAYNRSEAVIADIFSKRCNEFMSNQKIKEYLKFQYKYTEQTAQRYVELMWKKIKEEVQVDYEQDLATHIQFMEGQIESLTEREDSFVRLQWLKELNKIKGLAIQKIQVDGSIQHINTIKLVSNSPTSIESLESAVIDEISPLQEGLTEMEQDSEETE